MRAGGTPASDPVQLDFALYSSATGTDPPLDVSRNYGPGADVDGGPASVGALLAQGALVGGPRSGSEAFYSLRRTWPALGNRQDCCGNGSAQVSELTGSYPNDSESQELRG